MAMDLGGAKGGVKSDINVTPLVDVMLVLLIIMMIVAPLLQQGVNVQLPRAGNTAEKPETQNQTVLAIDAQGRFFLNAVPVREDDIADRLRKTLEDKSEKIVLIKADVAAKYSAVMKVMDKAREAQVEDIGLITDRKIIPGQPTLGGK